MAVAQQRSAANTANKPKPKVTLAFAWSGVNRRGQKISGEVKAETLSQAKADLIRQGIVVQKIRRKSESFLAQYGQSIKPMDIAVLTSQIATMLTAGVPLVQTLQLLAGSHEKKPMREMLATLGQIGRLFTDAPPPEPFPALLQDAGVICTVAA